MFWYDTREGKLAVGEAAYEDAVVTSLPGDIVPLAELLEQKDFDVDYSYYDRYPHKLERSRDEVLQYGAWVLHILAETQPSPRLRREHLERMSRLGLGMAYSIMHKSVGSISVINSALETPGFSPPGTYDQWTRQEFAANAAGLAKVLGRKPTKPDYRDWARGGHGPGPSVLATRIEGGIRGLNEMIGYPNIDSWELEDYITWGAKVMRANRGQKLTQPIMELLSSRKRGPSYSIAARKFGSLTNFQTVVNERYNGMISAASEAEVPPQFQQLSSKLDDYFGVYAPESAQDKFALVAKFAVTRQLVKGLRDSEYANIAYETPVDNFVDMLVDANYYVTLDSVVETAKRMGVFTALEAHISPELSYLRVSETEIALTRSLNAQRRQRARKRSAI